MEKFSSSEFSFYSHQDMGHTIVINDIFILLFERYQTTHILHFEETCEVSILKRVYLGVS